MRRIPTNERVGAELVPLFRRHLELCKVRPGETVLSFTNTMTNPAYASALFGACLDIGAEVFQVTVPSNNDWLRSRTIVETWKSVDMAVGMLASMETHWIYSDAHNEALEAGTRTLMIEEPEDVLRRLFPTDEVRARVEAGGRLMERARTLRVTSDAGTDLVLSKEGRQAGTQYGISDSPGRWDHWPSGMVSTAPVEGSAEGTLVIDEGDILLALGRYVNAPIRCTLRDGRVVNMEGGADARLLRDFFEGASDERAYIVSHIGWGAEHRARWNLVGLRYWEGGGVMDAESYYGNMLIAFGANFFRNLGGQNHTDFHLDIPTRNHSLWLDDVQIIDRGRFLIPELT
jgi:2,5-dihydroxypyridine 5,6-dioxygenase